MSLRAAIYARISQDVAGDALGVARQQADCTALAERKGWTVHETYVDNDVSAFSGKVRPRYRAMLEAVEAGEVDVVIAWHPDRLHRSPRELEDFIDTLENTGTNVVTVTAGDVDLGTPEGRLMARIVGSVARKESEDKSRRLRRKHQEIAEHGRLAGGGRRPFGYEADRVTIRRDEARLIRDAAERVLGGDSVRSIVYSWRAAGVATVTGAEWSPTTVKRLLKSARIAGLREHNGTVVAEAVWPAIITREQHERLRAILTDPGRNRIAGTTPRSYLLTGFVRCGRCDVPMTSRPTGAGKRRYVCTKDRGGCDRCGISADGVENLVVEMVLGALDTPGMRRALAHRPADDDGLAEVADLERRLEELANDHYVERIISRAEFMAARGPLTDRLDAARALVAQEARTSVLDAFTGDSGAIRRAWDAAPLDRRRALLAQIITSVTVAPTERANNRFDPSRVTVGWLL